MSASTKKNKKTPSFVLKPNYLSVTVGKRPFQLTSAHPSFNAFAEVLKKGQFAKLPKMVITAENLSNRTAGKVSFDKGVLYYKGEEVDSSLTNYIVKLAEEGKDVTKWVLFMDNLYKNPRPEVKAELFDFLRKSFDDGGIPLTDDGCFIAYKAVNDNYTDCYTGKISNAVGQIVAMARKDVDSNRRNHCSNGLHFCSRSYLGHFGGQKIMAVKINPKHVVSIPEDYGFAKGRCEQYEVLYEMTRGVSREKIVEETPVAMKKALVEVAKERKELIQQLLANAAVKRAIRRGKIAKLTIMKMTYGRLAKMAEKFFETVEEVKPVSTEIPAPEGPMHGNPLKAIREAAGLKLSQVAKALDVTLKAAWSTERRPNITNETRDKWIKTVQELTSTKGVAVSFPAPVAASRVSFGNARGVFDQVNKPVYTPTPAPPDLPGY